MILLMKITIGLVVCLIPSLALAELLYNPEHDEAMKNLKAVESANVTMQYQCGKFTLFISAYATQSDLYGRRATVTGKITSDSASHNISEHLTKAISRQNILTSQMSIACNGDKGAFAIEFTPTAYALSDIEGKTSVDIFWDGTVEGGTEIILNRLPKK